MTSQLQSRVRKAWILVVCFGLASVIGCDAAGSKAGGESKQEARDVDKQVDKVLDDFKGN